MLIFPKLFGLTGVWSAMPVSDVLSTLTTTYFLAKSGFLVKTIHNDDEFVLGI